jgi:beta-glucosidase/6-phospho-beta-glucosidase/beta-galactosidase
LIRVVALRKAAVAGAAGAAAWEGTLRLIAFAGFPSFDIVRELGTLAFSQARPFEWWTAGAAAHALVGVAWAVFYAYFFWARLRWPPALQGLAFSALPAFLAALIVFPQLRLMHMGAQIVEIDPRSMFDGLTAAKSFGLLLGHAIFGLTLGTLYTHPVGHPANGWRPKLAKRSTPTDRKRRESNSGFMFATGIECSYPTIEHGRWRRDQMAATDHYRRWQQDFERAREIGVTHIRYGPPLHVIFRSPGVYHWSVLDDAMEELRELGPEPIVDLCHFGLPTWLGDFQNSEIAAALAEYAGAFAGRYPWVRFYTPVNEMYVCARYSALEGIWNEQLRDEGAFVQAVRNLADASVRMTDAILARSPEALFINSESSEFCQPCCPDSQVQNAADFENDRRFLPLDLIYGHQVSETMRSYLREHGMSDGEYTRFMHREVPRRSIIGLDYYEWNERLIDQQGTPRALGELFGWYVIASQYYERYKRPLMHTETNRADAADAPRWLWRQWHNVQLLRRSGVPLVGFTWYSLTDQIDWNDAMSAPLGKVYPVGLLDLNRDPRSVGLSYTHLIDMHRDQPDYRECSALAKLLS